MQSIKRLLTVNPEAAKKVLGTSQATLNNAVLAEKILQALGASINHISDMFTDLEQMINSTHYNSAILHLESILGTQDKDTQRLWDATLGLAAYVVKECGAALGHHNIKTEAVIT